MHVPLHCGRFQSQDLFWNGNGVIDRHSISIIGRRTHSLSPTALLQIGNRLRSRHIYLLPPLLHTHLKQFGPCSLRSRGLRQAFELASFCFPFYDCNSLYNEKKIVRTTRHGSSNDSEKNTVKMRGSTATTKTLAREEKRKTPHGSANALRI